MGVLAQLTHSPRCRISIAVLELIFGENKMNTLVEENKEKVNKVQTANLRLARRASKSSVVLALPQPGGADILRAKKQLSQK